MESLTVVLELVRVEEAADPAAFRFGVQEYLLRSDDGTHAPATLRWDDAWMQALARARDRDPEATRAVGAALRRFLEVTRFAAAEAQIERALQEGRRVRVELFSSAAELHALPWELLTLASGRHLGELSDVELVYRWPGARPAPPASAASREGGRLLVAWSRACGNVGESFMLDAVEAATRSYPGVFQRERDVVGEASLPAIVAALEAGARDGRPPTLLLLLCHGAPNGAGYGLGLDDGRGGRQVVDSGALRRALAPFAGHLRALMLMACDAGNPGQLGAQLGSVAQELHRGGFAAVIAPRYPITGAAALTMAGHVLTGMLRETWSIERAFQGARERLIRDGSADFAAFQLYGHAAAGTRPIAVRPYRGLLSFEREHCGLFFGRDAERAETLADLDALIAAGRPRLLVVAGASGTGKSSLVLAAVRVALEARGWRVAVLRPGFAPREALAAALRERAPDGTNVLVVDQFEEVFTHGVDRGRGDEVGAFVRDLWAMAARPGSRDVVIVTLRIDYLGRCGELALDDAGARLDRIVYDEPFRVFVPQMGPEGLRAVIEHPAERVGLRVEAGLADRLIREVSGESNALPLLSYVLDELWRTRDGDALTHAALDAAGGVSGALSRHADAVVDALDEPARAQARRIFVGLVNFGGDRNAGTRRLEEVAELRSRRDPEAWDRAAAALVAARLIVRRSDGPETLEVAHEALIRRWDRLWQWYQADRDALVRRRELERLLEQYRRDGALNDRALALGQQLIAGLDSDEVAPEAAQMIAASSALARRRLWVRRGLVAAAISTLTLFLAIATVLYLRADESAALARSAAERARSAARLAAAERLLEARPHLAAALLRGLPRADLSGWRPAVFATVHEPLPAIWPLAERPTAFAFAPDGTLVAGVKSGALHLFPADGGPARTFAGPPDPVELAFSPDGAVVYAVHEHRLAAWALGPDGLTKRAEVDLPSGAYPTPGGLLQIGGRTGAVLIGHVKTQSLWRHAGERFEPLGERPRCLAYDAAGERSLRRIDDDAAQIETWTGELVARVDSPGIGRASRVPGGVSNYQAAWRWPTGQPLGPRRPLSPAELYQIRSLAVFADSTAYHEKTSLDYDPGRLCTLRVGATTPTCEELPAGAALESAVEGQIVVGTTTDIQLRIADTLALDRRLRGFAAPRGATHVDPRGHVAVVGPDDTLWRWRAGDTPSRRTFLDPGWFDDPSMNFSYRPSLQAAHARIVAVNLRNSHSAQYMGLGLEVWPLQVAELPELPPARTAEVHLADGEETYHYVVTPDVVVAATGDRLVVFTPREARIDQRSVPLPAGVATLVAATPDGSFAFMTQNEGMVRLDIRGDVPAIHTIPRLSQYTTVRTVDPSGRTLVSATGEPDVGDPDVGDLVLVDVETGARLDPTALGGKHLRQVAFSPDGAALALGASDGAIVVVSHGAERSLAPLRTFQLHHAEIAALEFSADGTALVGADTGGNVVVWRGYRERDDTIAVVIPERVWKVGLGPDNGELWALSKAGDLRTWTLRDDDALAGLLAERSKYCLSAREWIELVGVSAAEADELARRACAGE